MFKLKPFLLAGLALSALVVTSLATPIVTNGSFETPNTDNPPYYAIFYAGQNMGGWQVSSTQTGATDIINNAYGTLGDIWRDAVDGTAHLYLGDSLKVAGISQVVQLEAGHNYDLSFWFSDLNDYSSSLGAKVTTNLTADIGGGSVFSGGARTYTLAADADWTQYTLAFTAATTGNYTLNFASFDGYAANLDDIRITDNGVSNRVPDAGSTAGLLAGALVVAAGLRRRFAH